MTPDLRGGVPQQRAGLLPGARTRRRPRSGALPRLGRRPTAQANAAHATRETCQVCCRGGGLGLGAWSGLRMGWGGASRRMACSANVPPP
jgi:hypothetical protein